MTPCNWCDLPEDQHPAYRALMGVHDYEAASGPEPARPIVPHPAGGVTMPAQETPSGRWPAPPTYRTGRVGPLPPVPDDHYPPGAVDLSPPEKTSKRGMLTRLRNAMKGTS